MGTESTASYLILPRERGHTLTLVITAESRLSLSHRECHVHIAPPDLIASPRGSDGTVREELALQLIIIKTVGSAGKLMM